MKYVLYFSFNKDIGYINHDINFVYVVLVYNLKKNI